jgi:HD-like signal output (HDOD) protein
MEFLTGLAHEVSKGTVNLPSFPKVMQQVLRVFEDPDSTAEQLVKVLSAEPMLAAKLLRTSNSAAYIKPGRPVTDLKNAVTRLGQAQVQSVVMAFAMQQLQATESLRPIACEMALLWQQSITIAAICYSVAGHTRVNPDEALFTGLVSGIGRLYILARAANNPALSGNRAFLDLVDGWQASIGKSVLENWGFNEPVAQAVGAQDDFDRPERHIADLTDVLVVSTVLAAAFKAPKPRQLAIEGISAFKLLNLGAAECKVLLEQVETQIAIVHTTLGL